MPGLAVLIDCWDVAHSPCRHSVAGTHTYNQCMQNIQDFCLTEPDLVSVCLATYGEPHTAKMPRDGAWWHMADRFFNLETKFDVMRRQWQSTEFEPMDLTHDIIRHMPDRPGQHRFSAFDTVQLLYYCNYVMPEIDRIWFLGAAWDICVKIRPVGWLQIAALKYHNMFLTDKQFLSHQQCTVTEHCEFPEYFDPCWHRAAGSPVLELQLHKIVW